MVQLTAIIVREFTHRHNYRWHVTMEKYIVYNYSVSIKKMFKFIRSVLVLDDCLKTDSQYLLCLIDNMMMI